MIKSKSCKMTVVRFIELKKIINNISDKYKERMERLLNLVSYEQGSCFYINKSVIETNNKKPIQQLVCFVSMD
ncbi:Uncharacterised protein [Escherichia coli]|nr:Uncharacterised protein [Escherichia coli]